MEKIIMKKQQAILGSLCILLPVLSILFGLIGYFCGVNEPGWYESISATYYSNSKVWMIGLLFATSIYFFAYKGYDKADNIITTISAIMAFGIIAFPCSDGRATTQEIVGLFCLPTPVSGIVHNFTALALYSTFIIQTFRFLKSSGEKTKMKKIRNAVYIGCIACMFIGVGIVATEIIFSPAHWFILMGECFLQLGYGFAWLTKAGVIKFLNDK